MGRTTFVVFVWPSFSCSKKKSAESGTGCKAGINARERGYIMQEEV